MGNVEHQLRYLAEQGDYSVGHLTELQFLG